MFSKYFQIIRISLENGFTYRFNFIMWRVRNVIRFVSIYYFWDAVFAGNPNLYGYDRASILTYVFLSQIIWTIVLSTRTDDVAGEISTGVLSNYLLKPLSYYNYWGMREIADKLLNIAFNIVEMTALYFIIKPPLVLPQSFGQISFFLLSIGLAVILYYQLAFFASLLTFWFREDNGWPIRFMFSILISFMTGGFFPLNILPPKIFLFFYMLPTSALIFTPVQIFLGAITGWALVQTFILSIIWILILRFLLNYSWRQGIKIYEAEGR